MGDKIYETVQMCDVECVNKNGCVDAAWTMNECDTAKEIVSNNKGKILRQMSKGRVGMSTATTASATTTTTTLASTAIMLIILWRFWLWL